MKVGRDQVINEKTGKNRKFAYSDVVYDKNGWADAKKFLPLDFDLLFLKIKGKQKIFSGWHNDKHWEGSKINRKDDILFWKKNVQTGLYN